MSRGLTILTPAEHAQRPNDPRAAVRARRSASTPRRGSRTFSRWRRSWSSGTMRTALFELFEQGMEWAGKKGEWSTLCAHALPRPFAAFGCAVLTSAVCLRPAHATAHATTCAARGVSCPSALFAPAPPPRPPPRLRLTQQPPRARGQVQVPHAAVAAPHEHPDRPRRHAWLQQEEGKVVGWAPNSLAFARLLRGCSACSREPPHYPPSLPPSPVPELRRLRSLRLLRYPRHQLTRGLVFIIIVTIIIMSSAAISCGQGVPRPRKRPSRSACSGPPSLSRRFGAGMVQVMRLVSSLMQKDSQCVALRPLRTCLSCPAMKRSQVTGPAHFV